MAKGRVKNKESQSMPASEREQKVWDVSRQFMRGEISVERFEQEERKYTPDYGSAMYALSQSGREKQSGKKDKANFS